MGTTACRQPAAADPVLLRPVLDRAVVRLRRDRPEAAAAVEELHRRAEVASAAAAAAPWWRRRPELAAIAWERAVAEAAWQVTALTGDTEAARRSWMQSRDAAEAEVQRARAKLQSPGMRHGEAMALSRAEVLLDSARQLATAGRFDAAIDCADQAAAAALVVEQRWQEEHRRFADPDLLIAWRRMAEDVVERSARTRSSAIVVDKLGRRLLFYRAGRLTLTVPAELGANGLQPKRWAGDRATPEGLYHVTVRKEGASTMYSKALLIDYPNREDLRRFRTDQAEGRVPHGVGPGSLIEIHGNGGSGRDWTDGCVALSDGDMDLVFERVSQGTPVLIIGSLEGPLPGVGQ